jgi:hypothetical protein
MDKPLQNLSLTPKSTSTSDPENPEGRDSLLGSLNEEAQRIFQRLDELHQNQSL